MLSSVHTYLSSAGQAWGKVCYFKLFCFFHRKKYFMCLFQSRPTRRSKLSQQFEGAASLPSLETPTPTSLLLLPWYSLLCLSATPNQVWASAFPVVIWETSIPSGHGLKAHLEERVSLTSALDLKSCACVWKTTEINTKVSVCRNRGSNICFAGQSPGCLVMHFTVQTLDSDRICHLLL